MSNCTCFYCRQSAPCLCDTMIERIVDNINREQEDMDSGEREQLFDDVEYPIYE